MGAGVQRGRTTVPEVPQIWDPARVSVARPTTGHSHCCAGPSRVDCCALLCADGLVCHEGPKLTNKNTSGEMNWSRNTGPF